MVLYDTLLLDIKHFGVDILYGEQPFSVSENNAQYAIKWNNFHSE